MWNDFKFIKLRLKARFFFVKIWNFPVSIKRKVEFVLRLFFLSFLPTQSFPFTERYVKITRVYKVGMRVLTFKIHVLFSWVMVQNVPLFYNYILRIITLLDLTSDYPRNLLLFAKCYKVTDMKSKCYYSS